MIVHLTSVPGRFCIRGTFRAAAITCSVGTTFFY